MCGRTACTLEKCCLVRACSYTTDQTKLQLPEWKDICDNREYFPSYNLSPSSLSPVLIAKSHLEEHCNCEERIICPMSWGLVPSWHRGDPKEFAFKTNNCRAETILEKPTYSRPFKNGKRCVVLADGFFEWKGEKKAKQPYFIYFPQNKKMEEREWIDHREDWWNEKKGWCGPRLLTMAGIYDCWRDKMNEMELYSYAIVTVEASSSLKWMHTRMPAILDGEDDVSRWLDYEHVPYQEAVKLLKPITNLDWHPVSTIVNNSRNKEVQCVLPLIPESPKKDTGKTTLLKWFKPKRSSPSSATNTTSSPKRLKKEKK